MGPKTIPIITMRRKRNSEKKRNPRKIPQAIVQTETQSAIFLEEEKEKFRLFYFIRGKEEEKEKFRLFYFIRGKEKRKEILSLERSLGRKDVNPFFRGGCLK